MSYLKCCKNESKNKRKTKWLQLTLYNPPLFGPDIHLGIYKNYQNFHPLILYGYMGSCGAGADLPHPGWKRDKEYHQRCCLHYMFTLHIYTVYTIYTVFIGYTIYAAYTASNAYTASIAFIGYRVTLIVGLPPRLTSFWIISSQISSQILHFLSARLAGLNN